MHDSVAASRSCSFINYFLQIRICHFHSSPKDAENILWHCWLSESQGETPQRNLTYPCAEFNLQNITVQLGGWFRVKGPYLCSSSQLWIFNLCYCCRPSLQNVRSCQHLPVRNLVLSDLWIPHFGGIQMTFWILFCILLLGKAAFLVTEGRFTIQLSERIAFLFLCPICSF